MSALRSCAGVRLALAAASASLWLSGCGFHLEGRDGLPPSLSTVRIDAVDTQSDFYVALRRDLRAAGSQIISDPNASASVIHVLQDGTANNIVAVSTLNVPVEYELTYTVRFSVEGPGGQQLMGPQTRTLVQSYSYSESEQLAKQREARVLTNALAQQLVGVVMRQLSRL